MLAEHKYLRAGFSLGVPRFLCCFRHTVVPWWSTVQAVLFSWLCQPVAKLPLGSVSSYFLCPYSLPPTFYRVLTKHTPGHPLALMVLLRSSAPSANSSRDLTACLILYDTDGWLMPCLIHLESSASSFAAYFHAFAGHKEHIWFLTIYFLFRAYPLHPSPFSSRQSTTSIYLHTAGLWVSPYLLLPIRRALIYLIILLAEKTNRH